ncbi:FHA domain-containing protein [Gilvimarinus polysaccharolyticus]|uniref:FHA domain-containing protein n=1 Tax=Gilvimarinus polysaccharolyticus TaxID=863921 RepID=UPI000673351D|nr:FHA domain-containing protein [Gilvimarinus polysaccharolyticus]
MLKIRFKNKKYSAVWLVEPSVEIGRDKNNQLVVDAPDVADRHLKINVEHEQLELVNLVPSSEVLLNGKEVKSPRKMIPGDIITLAGIELEVIDPKVGTAAASTAKVAAKAEKTSIRVPKSTGWALKANHSALQNRVFPLRTANIVGRSSDCDISLAAAHLSRRHAELNVIDGVLYVKDLGSANGTFLNGRQVTESRVKRGDDLRFDTLSFGVIGPSDEMSQTTVRQPGKPALNAGKSHGPRSMQPASTGEVRESRENTNTETDKPRYGAAGLLVLGVLTVIVVVALYLTRS